MSPRPEAGLRAWFDGDCILCLEPIVRNVSRIIASHGVDGGGDMSPFDARHGTYAGAVAHWGDGERPCDDCARAEWRYRKRRKLRHLRGEAVTVPAVGILRRFQALHALGYTGPQIAEAAGVPINSLRSIGYHRSATVRAATASAVEAAFDRLCMTRPEGQYANRARSMAARRGWVPPLAWDDIDDPAETPTGWRYVAPDRATILAELDAQHVGITATCTELGVTRKALEKWCARHDLTDLYGRLIGREQPRYWRNGVSEAAS